jgi:hypothetical protein
VGHTVKIRLLLLLLLHALIVLRSSWERSSKDATDLHVLSAAK